MGFESISAMMGDVARLLVQLEKSTDPDERKTLIKKLRSAHSAIESDVRDAEREIADGNNRRFEAAVFRSALTTLAEEMKAAGLIEP